MTVIYIGPVHVQPLVAVDAHMSVESGTVLFAGWTGTLEEFAEGMAITENPIEGGVQVHPDYFEAAYKQIRVIAAALALIHDTANEQT